MEEEKMIQETNEEEMVDVEVWEFSLDDEEIGELIKKLQELKQTKTSFSFDINEENEILVHHEDEEGGE